MSSACLALVLAVLALLGPPGGVGPLTPAGESRPVTLTAESTADRAPAGHRPPVPGAGPAGVLRPFAAPPQPWGRGHRGVDLAAAPGQRVVAPAPGTVSFTGMVAGRPVVTIRHDDGLTTSLEPVTATAARGDRVAAGDPVGTLAEADHCGRPCVHWGARVEDGWAVGGARFDRYMDPLVLVGWSGPSVLWPSAG